MPIYIARYFNYFGDEGLAADVVTTGGGGPDVAALIAGEAQFTAAGPINQLALFQEGKKTLAVAGFLDTLINNLVMRKDLYEQKGLSESSSMEQKLAALKGTKISVTRPGALTDMVARSYLRRANLDPEKDAQIVATTSGQPQMAALEQKAVDVASITSPAAELTVARGVAMMLVNNTRGEDPFFKPFTQQSVLVREDYARQNTDTVKAFARAIVKANKWAREHSAEEGAKIMNFYVPALKVEDIARDYGAIKDAIPANGCHSEKGVMGNVELFKAAGLLKTDIKYSDLATNEFLPEKCP
jgi:NitT/TauT family transport system substrate-binding protein